MVLHCTGRSNVSCVLILFSRDFVGFEEAQARGRIERRIISTEEKGFCSHHSHLDHAGVWLSDSLMCYSAEGSSFMTLSA